MYITILHHWVWIHVLLITACVIGLCLAFARAFSSTTVFSVFALRQLHGSTDRLIYLTTRIGWPPFVWAQYVMSAMAPIMYMLFPPTTPDRETLLERDERTQVAYPRRETRMMKQNSGVLWRYLRALLAIIYTVALLVLGESLI